MKYHISWSVLVAFATMGSAVEGFTPSAFLVSYRAGSRASSYSSSIMMSLSEFDFDVAIIGCGVGGHGAALHARSQNLKTAVFSGNDVGGTCVNRGCVQSKALLAASGRVREIRDASHLKELGITVDGVVSYDRAGIADHAKNVANSVKIKLEMNLIDSKVDVIPVRGVLTGKPHEVRDESTGQVYTAKVRGEAAFICPL